MPRLNGFEVLARLPAQPIVVFTTAHDQARLDAFAVNSVDYLLKPVDPDRLDRALGRVERLRSRVDLSPPDLQGLLRTLADSLWRSRPAYPERIASRLGERLWFMDLDGVTHFFAEDKLTYASVGGKGEVRVHRVVAAGDAAGSWRLPHPPRHHHQRGVD
jgi:two-component system LytT family response regulator